jgi:esterase/lipase
MKKLAKWLLGIIVILFLVYLIGPKPSEPNFEPSMTNLPSSLLELENQINKSEMLVKGIKPDNEARIVWADTLKKEKTKIAFLYLHGFSASQAEGDPVHRNLAKKYNANLYLARLEEHGIEAGDSTMINLTADNYEASAGKALDIAKKLGDEVIIIGTSAGGALTLFLASCHPEVKAIVLYSPCVKLYDQTAVFLDKPWGLQIVRKVFGGKTLVNGPDTGKIANYWQSRFRIEGLVALQNLISHTMKAENFVKIKCPVFLAYYYKNEEEQDKTVSVPAMLEMFDKLGTIAELKRKVAFPNASDHVISSYITSKDWQSVENETVKFIDENVKL